LGDAGVIEFFGQQISWAQIIAGFLGVQILGLVWHRSRRVIARIWDAVFSFVPAVYRFHHMRDYFRAGGHVWDYRKVKRLTTSQRQNLPKILTVMNFKGGVGKTTLVANLACCAAKRFGLKVLVVDLDYQGSLSSLLRPVDLDASRTNLVGDWLKSKRANGVQAEFFKVGTFYPELSIDLVTADYELTEIENNQLQRWLLHADESTLELPTKFARTLAYKRNGFVDYDLVIMDAPPRLSVASINALVATSHILIPAKLEHLATEPINKLLSQLLQLKLKFGAKFSVLGAVCNMTHRAEGPTIAEQPYFTSLNSSLPADAKVYRPFIPDKTTIGKPGTTPVGYMLRGSDGDQTRKWFDELTYEVLVDMGVVPEKDSETEQSQVQQSIAAAE
jgi:chromosome partitioning protein